MIDRQGLVLSTGYYLNLKRKIITVLINTGLYSKSNLNAQSMHWEKSPERKIQIIIIKKEKKKKRHIIALFDISGHV